MTKPPVPARARTVAKRSGPDDPRVVAVALAIITLAAAGLRLVALRFQPTVTFDGTEYVRFAEAIAGGRPFASVFAPGYPALTALAHVVVPDRVGAAVAVSMLAGVALPAIVWALARGPLGDRGALLPALACALHPELARHSAITMSESAYIAALYLAFASLAGTPSLPGGLALGLACAIRPEGLVAAAALAVPAARSAVRDPARRRAIAVAALGFVCVALATVAWYRVSLGVWTLTPKIAALHAAAADWRAAEPALGGAPGAEPPLAGRVLASVRSWPANAWSHAVALTWSWPWPLLALSLWGLVRRRGIELAGLAYLPLLPFLGLSQQGRFALAAIPALAIAASAVFFVERTRVARVAAVALGAFGVVACGWALADAFRTPFDGDVLTDKRAGEWLAGVAAPGDPVVDRKPFVAFYAGCPHRVLADAPYDALLDDLVRTGARWLVLEEYVVHQMRPQLAPLLDSAAAREREPRLELAYARADAGQGSLAIFRVIGPGRARTGARPVVELHGFPASPPGP